MKNKIRAYRSLLIGVLLVVSLAAAGPSYAHGQFLAMDVHVDFDNTFIIVDDGDSGGPFFVSGEIFAPGTTTNPIGTFLCWGYFGEGGAVVVVSQEYELDGRGKIQTQGVEDFGEGASRAVVGGTGDFHNVRGQATSVVATGFGFEIRFALIGATGGK